MNINVEKIKKICVIQLQPFGDVFLTTSYFGALKKRFPHAEIVFLTKAPYHKVLRDHPLIDRIISIPKKSGFAYGIQRIQTWIQMFTERFDIVIDQQYMLSSQQLCLASCAKYRVGYVRERRNIPLAYNVKVGPKEGTDMIYSATAKFDIVEPLGIALELYELFLSIAPQEQTKIDNWIANELNNRPFVLFSPGSTAVYKKWGAQGFATVADHFASREMTPVFIWGPGEEADVESVRSLMKEKSIVALPTTIPEGVALLKRAKLFVTNDGGINHLAIPAKVPTIAMFGNTFPGNWSPAGTFNTHHHFYNPSRDKDDPLWGINPADVIALGDSLL